MEELKHIKLASELWESIHSSGDSPSESLRKFAEDQGSVFAAKFSGFIADEQPDEVFLEEYDKCTDYTSQEMTQLLQSGPSEVEFYEKVLEIINAAPTSHPGVKAILLSVGFLSGVLPYYDLGDGEKIEDQEFRSLSTLVLHQVKQLKFLLLRPYSQKTERASLILKVLDSVAEPDQRTVLLVHLLELVKILDRKSSET